MLTLSDTDKGRADELTALDGILLLLLLKLVFDYFLFLCKNIYGLVFVKGF